MNNMKVCPPSFDYEGTTRDNAQMSRRTETPKCDSTMPQTSDGNESALANQRLKKPHRSSAAADYSKCNVSDMGMFFLSKPDTKVSEVFPKGMAELVCVDFTYKGCECARENCTHIHPRKVGDLKKETINAIGKHLLRRELAGLMNGIS